MRMQANTEEVINTSFGRSSKSLQNKKCQQLGFKTVSLKIILKLDINSFTCRYKITDSQNKKSNGNRQMICTPNGNDFFGL